MMGSASITELRSELDAVDERLVTLLNERARLSLRVRALKGVAGSGSYDARREAEIFTQVRAANEGPLYDDQVQELFAAVLKVMKELRA